MLRKRDWLNVKFNDTPIASYTRFSSCSHTWRNSSILVYKKRVLVTKPLQYCFVSSNTWEVVDELSFSHLFVFWCLNSGRISYCEQYNGHVRKETFWYCFSFEIVANFFFYKSVRYVQIINTFNTCQAMVKKNNNIS